MVYGVESMLKKVEGTTETEETQEGRIFPATPGIPMASVNTSIVSYRPGSSHPPEIRHDIKLYTPKPYRAMGKALAPLRDCFRLVGKGECALKHKQGRCGSINKSACSEYGALLVHVQVADTSNAMQIYEEVFKFYFLHYNLIGKFYSERQ
ncbi:hypothetical protein KIL84_010360 [Mauremys mutica]|uniref:Uncharacterized protein n=1 Tax=Mauremys mutica TaxID=74926 RepID=A0A9D3XBI2_9SAUR|nr:hypothetical protein KIL84_010360 [Mauremys mutica]